MPSATEIVFKLGLGDSLCGVSFECDYPIEARDIPVISGTALPVDGSLSAQQIDSEVSSRIAAGLSIYTLDDERLADINPDLILAQDLCRVCAVPSGAVQDALEIIGCHANVVSLDPRRLEEVIECIGTVGAATGTQILAEAIMADLNERLKAVKDRVADKPKPRVLFLEWPDPLFNGGHWVPDMITAAGGIPVLGDTGERSRRIEWEEIHAKEVDITIFSPCGFDLDGALIQADILLSQPEAKNGLGLVYAVNANAHFSRPGPRVVDGVELLAELFHGDEIKISADLLRRIF